MESSYINVLFLNSRTSHSRRWSLNIDTGLGYQIPALSAPEFQMLRAGQQVASQGRLGNSLLAVRTERDSPTPVDHPQENRQEADAETQAENDRVYGGCSSNNSSCGNGLIQEHSNIKQP